MKALLNYKFESLNEYINRCRSNPYSANKVKQQETNISALCFSKYKKIENYPIEIVFYWHMKSKTADIDGRLCKNIIDGMVRSKLIIDDCVKYINKISSIYVQDDKDYLEVEIKDSQSDSFNYKLCMKHPNCKGCPKEMECDMK